MKVRTLERLTAVAVAGMLGGIFATGCGWITHYQGMWGTSPFALLAVWLLYKYGQGTR